jgi:hypothetical protein
MSEFAWLRKGRGRWDNYCRPCRAVYLHEHYAKHKERYVAQAVRRKKALVAERAEWLIAFFRAHPCVACGETDPLVLEFDHLRDKKFNITVGVAARSWHAVLDEIGKCEVVCSNCHRRRTATRTGWLRAALARE